MHCAELLFDVLNSKFASVCSSFSDDQTVWLLDLKQQSKKGALLRRLFGRKASSKFSPKNAKNNEKNEKNEKNSDGSDFGDFFDSPTNHNRRLSSSGKALSTRVLPKHKSNGMDGLFSQLF